MRPAFPCIFRSLVPAAALAVAGCGLLGSDDVRDPYAEARDECVRYAELQLRFGYTVQGPYAAHPLREWRLRERDGGLVIRAPEPGACADQIAADLLTACQSAACGASGTQEACLVEVEYAFRRPSDVCAACGDLRCTGDETPASCDEDCRCGDGVCEPRLAENVFTCAADCRGACGDGVCGSPYEACGECGPEAADCETCDVDCCVVVCGDAFCDAEQGETVETCEQDCGSGLCGDGVCAGRESRTGCPADCGDLDCIGCTGAANCLVCGENCSNPAAACGDGVCEDCEVWTCTTDCADVGFATCRTLPDGTSDCPEGPYCGDGVCAGGPETPRTCPWDCPRTPGVECGDGVCTLDDELDGCTEDCGMSSAGSDCGDGYCRRGETEWYDDNPFRIWACDADCQPPAATAEIAAVCMGEGVHCGRAAVELTRGSNVAAFDAVVDCSGATPVVVQRCDEVCHEGPEGPRCVDCTWDRVAQVDRCDASAAPTCANDVALELCLPDPVLTDVPECGVLRRVACVDRCEGRACTGCAAGCPLDAETCDPARGYCEGTCGDGICSVLEDAWRCPDDCGGCRDGYCIEGDADPMGCADCACNGVCESSAGELEARSAESCFGDYAICVCGDGSCTAWERAGGERPCPEDCGS